MSSLPSGTVELGVANNLLNMFFAFLLSTADNDAHTHRPNAHQEATVSKLLLAVVHMPDLPSGLPVACRLHQLLQLQLHGA